MLPNGSRNTKVEKYKKRYQTPPPLHFSFPRLLIYPTFGKRLASGIGAEYEFSFFPFPLPFFLSSPPFLLFFSLQRAVGSRTN